MENEKTAKNFLTSFCVIVFTALLFLASVNICKYFNKKEPITLNKSEIKSEIPLNTEETVQSETLTSSTENNTDDDEIKPANDIKSADTVVFNPNSKKYHKANCEWAQKCKRCIKISKQQAINQGGVPCKVCSKKH